jgi:hypothetical protein
MEKGCLEEACIEEGCIEEGSIEEAPRIDHILPEAHTLIRPMWHTKTAKLLFRERFHYDIECGNWISFTCLPKIHGYLLSLKSIKPLTVGLPKILICMQ